MGAKDAEIERLEACVKDAELGHAVAVRQLGETHAKYERACQAVARMQDAAQGNLEEHLRAAKERAWNEGYQARQADLGAADVTPNPYEVRP